MARNDHHMTLIWWDRWWQGIRRIFSPSDDFVTKWKRSHQVKTCSPSTSKFHHLSEYLSPSENVFTIWKCVHQVKTCSPSENMITKWDHHLRWNITIYQYFSPSDFLVTKWLSPSEISPSDPLPRIRLDVRGIHPNHDPLEMDLLGILWNIHIVVCDSVLSTALKQHSTLSYF